MAVAINKAQYCDGQVHLNTGKEYSRVSFYDGFYVLEYLVVNRIVVERVLFKWFNLR